jgi:hypothetical protein
MINEIKYYKFMPLAIDNQTKERDLLTFFDVYKKSTLQNKFNKPHLNLISCYNTSLSID